MFSREALVDDELPGGHRVKKGDLMVFSPYLLHRNPKLFKDGDRFDPSRFSTERLGEIAKDAYLPFGIGPRRCIAANLAMTETKLVLAHFIRSFKAKCLEEKMELLPTLTLKPKYGPKAKIQKR
jgi:cytochrome P450